MLPGVVVLFAVPHWMKSLRGVVSAVVLLVVLLVAVPGLLSTTRHRVEGTVQAIAGGDALPATDAPSDPLAPLETDWLAAEEVVSEPLADLEGALDCLVQPFRIVEIGSQTIGLIETLHVERGDKVEKGQVVVELEAGVERAAVEVARMRASQQGALRVREESLSLSATRRQRGSELFEKDVLSMDIREELETQARIAELELVQAKESRQLAALELLQAEALLARRTLRASISGVVTERLLEPGEIVDEETILKIAQVDPLRVDVLLPASRFGTARAGMRASIEPEFPVEASVVATVSIVDPVIDAASGTFSVRLDLPNPDGQIPGGLHCTVKFLDE